ncbi:DUF6300 family protein [Hamadaea tsunoensis]|uniref:DUF6300 family protein n=1 Tax=Hamadaea tsunoensis TaxID=53368 RepID=UPI0004036D57|nr:DUF6300 family protein [Hamadaea tsunoensis]
MTAVQVSVAGGRTCQRCGTGLCLTARIGTATPRRTVALCPRCDAGNPDAKRLIDYFAASPTVAAQDRGHVSELLGRWLGSLDDQAVARPSLAEAAEAWWAARQGGPAEVDEHDGAAVPAA